MEAHRSEQVAVAHGTGPRRGGPPFPGGPA